MVKVNMPRGFPKCCYLVIDLQDLDKLPTYNPQLFWMELHDAQTIPGQTLQDHVHQPSLLPQT